MIATCFRKAFFWPRCNCHQVSRPFALFVLIRVHSWFTFYFSLLRFLCLFAANLLSYLRSSLNLRGHFQFAPIRGIRISSHPCLSASIRGQASIPRNRLIQIQHHAADRCPRCHFGRVQILRHRLLACADQLRRVVRMFRVTINLFLVQFIQQLEFLRCRFTVEHLQIGVIDAVLGNRATVPHHSLRQSPRRFHVSRVVQQCQRLHR